MGDKVSIDGSLGEGGGQILRTALSLAALTGRELELFNIRAGRAKPGLQPQHLMAVQAAAEICGAEVAGAKLASRQIDFRPGRVRPGRHHFDIGTAGSTSLVLHTIYLPLALAAGGRSTVTITGGTHVPMAPCFHYLGFQWRHFMERIGLRIGLHLESAGYYPRGGGSVAADIQGSGNATAEYPPTAAAGAVMQTPVFASRVRPIDLAVRGGLIEIQGVSSVTGLPMSIAERQKHQAEYRLKSIKCPVKIEMVDVPGVGQGTMLLLLARCENGQACYYGLGARGKRAEAVADEAADALLAFLHGGAAIDEHMADQIVLPLAVAAGESVIATPRITQHLLTNIAVIRHFLRVEFVVEGELNAEGKVIVRPGR